MNINSVILVGNLARDPVTVSGENTSTTCVKLTIAVNKRVKTTDGWKDVPDYCPVTLFGKQAENAALYLRKGSLCAVEGRVTVNMFVGEDNEKHYKTEIIANKVHFGPKPNKRDEQSATPAPKPEINPNDIPS